MADRRSELLRQRALVQEHLAWLDREIAASFDQAAPTAPAPVAVVTPNPPSATLKSVPPAPIVAATTEPLPEADAILNQYRVPPAALKTDIRKGCFLYLTAAFVVVIAVVAALYMAFRR